MAVPTVDAQQALPKKGPSKASRYSSLPSGYVQVGTSQLYYRQYADCIDMMGFYDGYYYSSTYGDYGYKLSVKVGENDATRVDCLNGTTVDGVTVQPSVEQQGDLARICYTVTNANETDVTISMGVHADVMIGTNDAAPINRRLDTTGQTYGLTMLDGNGAQLCVLFGAGLAGVVAVNDFWFGHYSTNSDPYNMVGNYSAGSYYMQEGGGYDSGMGWCWKDRVIPAGTAVIFSYLIGVGEVKLEPNSTFDVTPDDPDGWNDLTRPHKLTLEGSYESPAGLDGRIEYAVEDSEEWTALTEMLPSGSTFSGEVTAMFDATKAIHVIRFRTVDNVGNTTVLHPIEYKDVSFYPVTGIEAKTYTGAELFQENLTCELEAEEYAVKNYQNNVRVGVASFTVEGVFPKTIGRRTYTFQIQPQPLSGELVLAESKFVYNGGPFTPEWQFSNEAYKDLKEGEDYTTQWSDNQQPGTGQLTVTGQNNYTGSLTAEILIDKAPFAIELLSLQLPPEELIYDELPHPASCSPSSGVGEVTITYLTTLNEMEVETPQPPTLPGSYKVLVAVAEGELYYGMEKTEVSTVTISLFNTEEYAYIGKIATDTENYHMYYGTRTKLVQFLQATQQALKTNDLATIHAAFLPQAELLAEAQASMEDYDKLAGHIYYTTRLLESYGPLFSDEIKETIQQTIDDLQTAYNYGAMTGAQIDQVGPQLQATVREELTKYLEPYTNSIRAMIAKGLTEDMQASALQLLAEVNELLLWEEYSIENVDYIKGVGQRLIALAAVLKAQVEDLAILRQAYLSLGGAETLGERWQFETAPYRLVGINFYFGRITEIDLNGCGLTGTLPTPFFMLPKLQTLDLGNNQLGGDIAEVWQQLMAMNQTSPLTTLIISNNDFTGNIGLIGNVCTKLYTLYASNNHLEECQPALSSSVVYLDLKNQTLDWTWDFTLSGFWTQTYLQQLPGILRYDHSVEGGVATAQVFLCKLGDWQMELSYDNGPIAASWVSSDYTGNYEELMDVTLRTSEAVGSTFRMSFKFLAGDANFNGYVDVNDLQTVIRYIFNDWGSGINFTAANLFVDERVNVQDVVRLVDVLLDANQPTSVKRFAPARTHEDENAAAHLFWRGNELVLRTDVPVAAADICIDGGAALSWRLQQMGFTLTEKHNEAGTHAVFYSLTDAVLPAGETVLATKGDGSAELTSAMLSDRDAQTVAAALAAPLPTRVSLMAADGTWTLVGADGTIAAQGTGRAQLQSARKRLGTGIYILQGANNQNQKITIK